MSGIFECVNSKPYSHVVYFYFASCCSQGMKLFLYDTALKELVGRQIPPNEPVLLLDAWDTILLGPAEAELCCWNLVSFKMQIAIGPSIYIYRDYIEFFFASVQFQCIIPYHSPRFHLATRSLLKSCIPCKSCQRAPSSVERIAFARRSTRWRPRWKDPHLQIPLQTG